jgi:putative ABC transport system permease protein
MFWRKRKQSDFTAEIEAHLELETEQLKEQGLSEEEARRAARRAFGNVTQAQERFYESGRWLWWDHLVQDLRFGLRMLAKNPGFAAVVVLTLGLGIGVNTAIFSFLDAILNLHFPIKEQNQIANLWGSNNSIGVTRNFLSIPDFVDHRQQNRVFDDLAAYSDQTFHLTNVAEPQNLSGNRVSFNYFHVLGVQPARGRNFLPEESEGGKHRVVILSHGLWQGSFGADPGILGRNITLNRESYTVIGVMPAGFRLFAGNADLWVPLDLGSSALSRGVRQVMVIGRLKPAVAKEQTPAEMNNLARRLAQAFPSTNKGWDVHVVLLQDEINKKLGLGLVFIMGPVVFVLLIACANVANLLLARASVREKEMAVRAAMGAGRLRLVRQLLTESVMLALLAGALGLLLGIWGMAILRSLFSTAVSGSPGALHLEPRVLGFALVLCLLTPLLFGLAPALYGTKLDLNETLKEGRRGSRAGGSHRLREYLVVSEVGLAVALLGLGGLLIRVLLVMGSWRPAVDPKNLLTMTVSLSESAYPHDSDVAAFYHRVLEGARAIPGVESVGVVDRPPLALLAQDRRGLSPIDLESGSGAEARASAIVLRVSPGFFPALRISQRRGRALTEQDTAGAARVALINETLARSWRGEDPIGKRLRSQSPAPEPAWITVVGVVGDAMIDERKVSLPGVYLPCAQNPERAMTFVVRTLTPPLGLQGPLKRALWAVDKDQPVEEMRTLEQVLSEILTQAYPMVMIVAAFAGLALLLASVGVYSVMSYVVAQRTHEIGVRMSLGARPRHVIQLVVKGAMVLILGGVVVGLSGAFVFGRILGHELADIGIRPYDPITFSCVSLVLMAAALLACYLPARRATKVDPMVALRYE